jgi:RNA polymerase sigma-70 factor (ECF subfamily)
MISPSKLSTREGDKELLAGIAAGDRRALEDLYCAYHRRLARFLTRFTPRYENVEEIINDTFLAVWRGAGDFRSASQVSTWIFGIAYRAALKSFRRQRHHIGVSSLDDQPEQAVDPGEQTEARDWIDRGLNQLPAAQRLALELAYHMGHSMEEIAAITDVPVGTVKARIHQARKKLRERMPQLGGEPPEPSMRDV